MAYIKSSEKAKEFKSGGLSLLAVGCIGLIGIVLVLFGVIPIRMNIFTKYLVIGVMGTLFLLFIIMGILSFKSYKTFAVKATSEDDLTRNLTQWCRENLTAEIIDAPEEDIEAEEISALSEETEELAESKEEPEKEEMKYFRRSERMKKLISDKFMNLDEAFLDSFVDDIYQEIFS